MSLLLSGVLTACLASQAGQLYCRIEVSNLDKPGYGVTECQVAANRLRDRMQKIMNLVVVEHAEFSEAKVWATCVRQTQVYDWVTVAKHGLESAGHTVEVRFK
ncbi:hypothetical protein Knedl_CDS0031 [Pseudomonas phage Knedl]|nr:hypothetical protein Knedl_CDS0031 [Pseudomonas phage Knedl]